MLHKGVLHYSHINQLLNVGLTQIIQRWGDSNISDMLEHHPAMEWYVVENQYASLFL